MDDWDRVDSQPRGFWALLVANGGWQYVMFLLCALIFGWGEVPAAAIDMVLRLAGEPVAGVVTEVLPPAQCKHTLCPTTWVRFAVAGDSGQGGWSRMATEKALDLVPGEAIGLLRLGHWPGFVGVEQAGKTGYRYAILGFSLLMASVGLGGLVAGLGDVRRAMHLRRHGLRRRAVVRERRPSRSQFRGKKLMHIHWKDETGQMGQSRAIWEKDLPKMGATIHVYVDPEGRLPPVWEGET